MGKMGNRIGWLEVTRFIAILLVLVIHTVDEAVYKSGINGDSQWYISQTFHLLGRLGVPLFFMITGSLLLPTVHEANILRFYLKRIPQFSLLILFYTILINVVHSYINHQAVNWSLILNRLSHGDTGPAYQLWFLYSIIAMYFAIPFISRMVNVMKNSEILTFIILSIAFFYLPIASDTLFGYRPFFSPINVEPANGFVSYVIVGYYITNRVKSLPSASIFLMLFLLIFSCSLLAQGYLRTINKMGGDGIGWYSSIFIFFSSIPLFITCKLWGDKIYNISPKTFTLLSKSSFCVFLLHLIPTWIILQYLVDMKIFLPLSIAISITLSYLICTLIYLSLHKIKYINKLVQ